MEAETKASRAEDLHGTMLDALIVAQSMENAVRTIMEPLFEIGEAFPIATAIEACLDKMASHVNGAVEVAQAAEAGRD